MAGRQQTNPAARSQIQQSRQTCKCQAETQTQSLQLSGFVCFSQPGTRLLPFSEQAVGSEDRKRCGAHYTAGDIVIVFLGDAFPPREARARGEGAHLLVTPGSCPLHFAPRIPESDQLLWTAAEIHLQGSCTQKQWQPWAPGALHSCLHLRLALRSSDVPRQWHFHLP